MKRLWISLFCCVAAVAQITGTVTNRTTGQPAAGITVGYYRLGNGMEHAEDATTNAQGEFKINKTYEGPGLVRITHQDVTYTQVLQMSRAPAAITFDIYNASSQQGAAKVSKHMILFAPSGGQMDVKETYIYTNDGKATWNDPKNGTLHFYLPPASGGSVGVKATAPGGLAITAGVVKTPQDDMRGVDFAIKPGETRFDLDYTVPYKEGDPYQGKIATKDDNTYLIVPNGVTLTGDHLNDLGLEPQTQMHIWGLEGASYKVALSGTAAAAPAAAEADAADSGPQIEIVNTRVLSQMKLILPLALGVLALGFALLYRAGSGTAAQAGSEAAASASAGAPAAAKETNERGRR